MNIDVDEAAKSSKLQCVLKIPILKVGPMITSIFLTTVLLPLLMGIAVAAVCVALDRSSPGRSAAAMALLMPVAVAVAAVTIEGLPPIPPVAARHKLPVILLAGAVVFLLLSLMFREPRHRAVNALLSLATFAIPAWWLGRNVIAADPAKAALLVIVLVIMVIVATLVSTSRSTSGFNGRWQASALPIAAMLTAIATAICAVTGGYIGMAQFNGAVAALIGGWVLVAYIRHLRGENRAFYLDGIAALSLVWTVALGVIMTVLFSPEASSIALVLSILPLATAVVLIARKLEFAAIPRFAQPLVSGAIVSIPAGIAIVIAAFTAT